MEVVNSITDKIVDYVISSIGRQIGYVVFYNRNIGDFKKGIEELKNTRDGVEKRTIEAEKNGDITQTSIRRWLERVDKIMEEHNRFGEVQVSKRCLGVPYPDLKSRYQQSRKAKKNTIDVVELQQSGNFERVSYSVCTWERRFKSNEVIEDFESRKSAHREIKEAIKDDKINIIGVYGTGGVGKTTLVNEVVKEVGNQFEDVVMAVISQTINLEKIQQQIADMLGVKFQGESDQGRADRLHQRLEKKKVLVILDDLWKRVDLRSIGIPFGGEHNNCKIVLTSRSEAVCIQMGTQKNIEIRFLMGEEAWNLFRKMAGSCVDSPKIKPLASKVVRRCSGLPIAIVTTARALRDKSLSSWMDAAHQREISKEVSSSLQLSYDYLEREEAKSLFLLCCIYNDDHNISIEDLWLYGFSLGLFENVDTEEVARNRTYALVELLKYSCLLQEGTEVDTVKMHDVVRDFAISIASKNENGYLVRSNPDLKEFPKSIQLGRYTTISLISDKFQQLPNEVCECPRLQLLYLECTLPSFHIPGNFFLAKKKLKVLVMSGMHFQSLPPSLGELENLQTLCLKNCNLEEVDMSIIGKLKELKFLSFIGSSIKELPKEIGELMHLKLLDISQCGELKIIPPDAILRLSRLEGLYMGDSLRRSCFTDWETERQDRDRRNISLRDLKHLSCLTSLKIHVPDENCLFGDEVSLFKNLSRFQISIGTPYQGRNYYLYSRALSFKNIPIEIVSTLLETCTEYLAVEECNGVEYIFNREEQVSSLEELHLKNLPMLKGIYYGQHICFHNLRVVTVERCPLLKNLFSRSIANNLSKLIELRVYDCEAMECIILEDDQKVVDNLIFPHLKYLYLISLPNLLNFNSKMDTETKEALFHQKVAFPALENLEVGSNNSLKSVFPASSVSSLRQLRRIYISSCDNMETIITKEGEEDESIIVFEGLQELRLDGLPNLASFYRTSSCPGKDTNNIQDLPLFDKRVAFPTLEKLYIESIGKFKSVVTFSLLQSLQSLEELFVIRCDSLEEVVVKVEDHEINVVLFPQLRKLTLKELPKVKHIMCWDKCPMEKLGFRNLIKINIVECNSMKSLLPTSIATDLVQLQELEIDSCKLIETIFANETQGKENSSGMIVFPKLHTLKLTNLPNLLSFYLELYMSSHTKLDMSSLKTLWLWCCPAMKTFTYSIPCPQKLRISDEIISKETPEKSNHNIYHRPLFNNKFQRSKILKPLWWM